MLRKIVSNNFFKLVFALVLVTASFSSITNSPKIYANNTTYYVSQSGGNDSNNGTSLGTPWKTMSKVSSVTFQPGDNILLNRGDTWTEQLNLHGNGTFDNLITVSSYGSGNKPLIQNSNNVITIANESGWKIQGLAIKNTSTADVRSNSGPNGAWDYNPNAIILDFSGNNAYSDIIIDGNEIYGSGVNYNGQGIFVQHNSTSINQLVLDRLTVSNNEIHHLGPFAFYSTAKWTGSQGSGQNRYPNYSDKLFRNVHIVDNVVHDMGVQGILLTQANHSDIKRNLVHDTALMTINPSLNIWNNWGPVGIFTMIDSYIDVKFNEVYGVLDTDLYDGAGIDIDWVSDHVTFQYNYAHDNEGPGMETMSNTHSTIKNNKLKGNGFSNVGTTIFNNQLRFIDFLWGSGSGSNMETGVRDLNVSENLIINDTNNPYANSVYAFHFERFYGGSSYINNLLTNNRVNLISTNNPRVFEGLGVDLTGIDNNKYFSTSGTTFYGNYNGSNYTSLSAWKTATGKETSSSTLTYETVAPTQVTGLSGSSTANPNKVSLSWSAASDSGSGIWHYNVYRSKTSGFTPEYRNMVGESTTTSFNDTEDLESSTTYYYTVVAEDNCGNTGTQSSQISVSTGSGLPSPWTLTDIGAPGTAGTISYTSDKFTVTDKGSGIGGTSDQFAYLNSDVVGDTSISAKLSSQTNSNSSAKSGLMFRESTNANSKFVMSGIKPNGEVVLLYRATTGGTVQSNVIATGSLPNYLKLEKNNTGFVAFISPDGNTWVEIGKLTLELSRNLKAGFAQSANSTSVSGSVEFAKVDASTLRGGSGGNLVFNAGFEEEGETAVPSGWTTWTGTGGIGAGANKTEILGGTHSGTYHGTHYKSTAYEVYTSQTIKGLKNGTYTLKAWVKSSGGQTTAYMEAKDFGGTALTQNITSNLSWNQITINNINVSNGEATFGFYSNANGGNWINFDDVEFFNSNLVGNPGFEVDAATQTPTGWSANNANVDASYTETTGGTHSGTYHGTHYKTSAYQVYTYQTKTNLENGNYTLKAWVKSSGGQTSAYMEAKDFGGTALTQNITYNLSWNQITISGINVTNGLCTIGFYSNASSTNWINFDDVEFYKS